MLLLSFRLFVRVKLTKSDFDTTTLATTFRPIPPVFRPPTSDLLSPALHLHIQVDCCSRWKMVLIKVKSCLRMMVVIMTLTTNKCSGL
ncbi:hypothetical protein L6452_33532 [Arctium lappa]|uniref:Uncharacterized protein n=1 Tax=Arctium lappa TaxID=4217 RepID=A0ACB8YJW2_ARCLA|nr:hypothetical protein L6452_33532 [Arctium lappa]